MTTTLPHYRTFRSDKENLVQLSLLDFNDSFTFNIASCLFELGFSFRVVRFDQIPKFLSLALEEKQKHIFVYGPGPGNPDHYKDFFPKIEKLLDDKNFFHLGICLGHQILWKIKGAAVERSQRPLHGQSINIEIPPWDGVFPKKYWQKEVQVQRYNSLAVKSEGLTPFKTLCDKNGELLMGHFDRVLTYQFHPESIGTSFPSLFFGSLSHFLYNKF